MLIFLSNFENLEKVSIQFISTLFLLGQIQPNHFYHHIWLNESQGEFGSDCFVVVILTINKYTFIGEPTTLKRVWKSILFFLHILVIKDFPLTMQLMNK